MISVYMIDDAPEAQKLFYFLVGVKDFPPSPYNQQITLKCGLDTSGISLKECLDWCKNIISTDNSEVIVFVLDLGLGLSPVLSQEIEDDTIKTLAIDYPKSPTILQGYSLIYMIINWINSEAILSNKRLHFIINSRSDFYQTPKNRYPITFFSHDLAFAKIGSQSDKELNDKKLINGSWNDIVRKADVLENLHICAFRRRVEDFFYMGNYSIISSVSNADHANKWFHCDSAVNDALKVFLNPLLSIGNWLIIIDGTGTMMKLYMSNAAIIICLL